MTLKINNQQRGDGTTQSPLCTVQTKVHFRSQSDSRKPSARNSSNRYSILPNNVIAVDGKDMEGRRGRRRRLFALSIALLVVHSPLVHTLECYTATGCVFLPCCITCIACGNHCFQLRLNARIRYCHDKERETSSDYPKSRIATRTHAPGIESE